MNEENKEEKRIVSPYGESSQFIRSLHLEKEEKKEEPKAEEKLEEVVKEKETEDKDEPLIHVIYDDDEGASELDEDDKTKMTAEEEEAEQKENEEASSEADSKGAKKVGKLYKGKPRVYHISSRADDSKWQVRLANGERAIRVFDTQQEGIDYASHLLKTMGGSIRVHSKKGTIRKN